MKYLVNCASFRLPTSPCFAHSVNFGTTSICNNCTMMDAVMYGMIPIAKMEKLASAPPPNTFMKPMRLLSDCCKAVASTFGTGINVPSLKYDEYQQCENDFRPDISNAHKVGDCLKH